MSMAERIQKLRKAGGLSQEELADGIGVSRQAVSKWESGQSTPDLDKVVLMSEYFQVTTDYLLKGVEPPGAEGGRNRELTSRILYIASTAVLAMGLLYTFGDWHQNQNVPGICVGMIIQAAGAAGYFIARLLSRAKAPSAVNRLNLALALFMPVSMLTGILCWVFFRRGWVAPYPTDILHTLFFLIVYCCANGVGFAALKKRGA